MMRYDDDYNDDDDIDDDTIMIVDVSLHELQL
jgi:hypothetical protein